MVARPQMDAGCFARGGGLAAGQSQITLVRTARPMAGPEEGGRLEIREDQERREEDAPDDASLFGAPGGRAAEGCNDRRAGGCAGEAVEVISRSSGRRFRWDSSAPPRGPSARRQRG